MNYIHNEYCRNKKATKGFNPHPSNENKNAASEPSRDQSEKLHDDGGIASQKTVQAK